MPLQGLLADSNPIGSWFVQIRLFGFNSGHEIWGLRLHFKLKFHDIIKGLFVEVMPSANNVARARS